MLFHSKHVKAYVGIGNNETLRSWVQEFQEYLSDNTNPGRGKSRTFTLDDIKVLKFVQEMRDDGFNFEAIHINLKAHQRADVPDDLTPETIEQVPDDVPKAMLVRRVDILISQLETMTEEIELLRDVKDENIRLNERIRSMAEERERLEKRINELIQKNEDLAKETGTQYSKGFVEGLGQRPPEKDE